MHILTQSLRKALTNWHGFSLSFYVVAFYNAVSLYGLMLILGAHLSPKNLMNLVEIEV